MSIFDDIAKSVVQLKDETLDLVTQALDQGEDPLEIIDLGIVAGIQRCGEKFTKQEYFVP